MLHNVNGNDLRPVVIVLAILLGIQGYPEKRSQQSSIQRNVLPSRNITWNRRDNSDVQIRKPQNDNDEARVGKLANINNDSESSGKIIFPDYHTHSTSTETKFNESSVVACNNATFCENPQSYPADLIRRAISARQDLKYLATVDVPSEFDQRLGGDTDESLCMAEEIIVFPKAAKNAAKEWMYVINEENFPQGVRIETCKTEGSSCRIIEGLATGYETVCKQKYVYRKLAALDSNNSVAADFFQFPSSCCCHVKFVGNVMTRIG